MYQPRGEPSIEERESLRAQRFLRASQPLSFDSVTLQAQLEEKKLRADTEKQIKQKLDRQILAADEEAQQRADVIRQQKRQDQEKYKQDLMDMMHQKSMRDQAAKAGLSVPGFSGLQGFSEPKADRTKVVQAELLKQSIYEKKVTEREAALSRESNGSYVPRDSFDELQRRKQLSKQFEQENLQLAAQKRESLKSGDTCKQYAPLLNEDIPAPVAQAEFRGYSKEETKTFLMQQPQKKLIEKEDDTDLNGRKTFAFVSSEEARLAERRRLARETAAENARVAALKRS
jgi:hypothetical protein